jgi:hypothetical protein
MLDFLLIYPNLRIVYSSTIESFDYPHVIFQSLPSNHFLWFDLLIVLHVTPVVDPLYVDDRFRLSILKITKQVCTYQLLFIISEFQLWFNIQVPFALLESITNLGLNWHRLWTLWLLLHEILHPLETDSLEVEHCSYSNWSIMTRKVCQWTACYGLTRTNY